MKLSLILVLVLCSACTNGDAPPPAVQETDLKSIDGSDFLLGKARSLCEIALAAEVAGHYEVERITSNMETRRGKYAPHSVIRLVGESFIGTATTLEIRTIGGQWPDGSTSPGDTAYTLGEKQIVFVEPKYQWADGLWGGHPEGVFHAVDGKYSTDWLRNDEGGYSFERIREVARSAVAGDCQDDITSDDDDGDRPEVLPEEEHEVFPDAG